MAAEISVPGTLLIGGGALEDSLEIWKAMGVARVLIVTDRFMVDSGMVGRLGAVLSAAGIAFDQFAETVPEPTSDCLEDCLRVLRQADYGALVALGGGSPIDTAKAAAFLAVHGGRMRDYKAPRVNREPGLPVVAIPTTAGTGSEVTRFTIISDSETHEKMLCAGPAFMPRVAIVDYRLTLTTPFRLTADTGIDALTHAIEAYVSRKANPFSDGMAQLAMKAIWDHLPTACFEPDNEPARKAVMLGANQAGMAFSNASVALVHGMSRPIGAHFHVAHGLSNAMLLPEVTAFSIPAAEKRYGDCARIMGLAGDSEPDALACERLVAALRQLNQDLQVPGPREYGLDAQRWQSLLGLMAEQALASGSPANNPRQPSAEEIIDLYQRIWSG